MVSASVRGMGVAVITNTSGCWPLDASRRRCITPKRCCSSTMARPSFFHSTSSSSSACVPMPMCTKPAAISFLSCVFSRAVAEPVSSVDDVAGLLEQVLEVEIVLAGEDFGGREHRRLIAVLDRDHRGFGGHQRLAAAHVALQQAAHRMRRLHIISDLLQHSLLRAGGFERQHGLDLLAHAIVQLERDAGLDAGLGALERQSALEPEEFLEDQSPLRRSAKGVEQPQVGVERGKVQFTNGRPAVRQLELAPNRLRQMILERLDGFENAMEQQAEERAS